MSDDEDTIGRWWVLDEDNVPHMLPGNAAPTPEQWARRQVRSTDLDGEQGCSTDVHISTVFLGLNHNFLNEGPPLLFETMVFGGVADEEMQRYETWDEAVAGHAEMIDDVIDAEREAAYTQWTRIEQPPKPKPVSICVKDIKRRIKVRKNDP